MQFLEALYIHYGITSGDVNETSVETTHTWVSSGPSQLVSRPIANARPDPDAEPESEAISRLMRQSLSTRPVLSVSGDPVECCGPTADSVEIGRIARVCEELDLSATNLSAWNEVRLIVAHIENLRSLVLSRTPLFGGMRRDESEGEGSNANNVAHSVIPTVPSSNELNEGDAGSVDLVSERVRTLVIAKCGASASSFTSIGTRFPGLIELIANGNAIDVLQPDVPIPFASLISLDLSDNLLASWEAVWPLKDCQSLQKLNLSNNPIPGVEYRAEGEDEESSGSPAVTEPAEHTDMDREPLRVTDNQNYGRPFSALRSLNLTDTLISRWQSVSELAKFPALDDLRLCKVPLELPRALAVGLGVGVADGARGSGPSGAASRSASATISIGGSGAGSGVGGSPAVVGSETRDVIRACVIAHVPKLACLNGGEVGTLERRGAESFFVRKIDKMDLVRMAAGTTGDDVDVLSDFIGPYERLCRMHNVK